ncbi:FAD-dependent oxidoreductase [Spirosoma utsteinense]|uniref:Choline dehydrogenase-like flavoprotein n=1 Tax=Spirosoma utsteinense TaxID=2585773 RepID=A0ABR6W378_9BACT|nr:GMC family oxidoreductase [Spirosoma utsteinense]MBC3785971.1 choline dehydrogenase-like flavoprotein [Spirosoma utsteinense]MBC3790669.1 choline dehydrogenase-like flavoprotein [Spirosoma utsteinense]
MANLIIDTLKDRTFDAIVIGSGMSGGWAAKELTEKGLQTLLLERGRDVKHVTDYPTAMLNPWEFDHRKQVPRQTKEAYSIASKNYAFYEGSAHFYASDADNPYVQDKPFDWIQGYQVGGRSLLWGRQTQRWSDFDFSGPARDGFAVDWPIRYADLAPWYSHVERFAGISGNRDGLATLPDGEFLPPHQMSCVESYFKQQMSQHYPDRPVVIGRVAHLTQPKPIHTQQGRGQCQHRTLCERGCPLGGYYSSNSSTIPWALKTGKLTLRPDSVVHSLIYDPVNEKATGVRVIDAHTGQMTEYYARIIFLNASALNTNRILLNSTSSRFPNGLGNDSGLMGTFIAFHSYRGRITAQYDGFADSTTWGRRPNSSYLPRFRNVLRQETDFLRGYATTFATSRPAQVDRSGFGADLKDRLTAYTPGPWHVLSGMMGETIPKASSTVRLDPSRSDRFGIPQLRVSVAYDENDEKMLRDFYEQFTEMYERAGFTQIQTADTGRLPGSENHEMGGVRMGHDPKTSLLNRWNQLHSCKNVFVTDGACMTSTSTQNPSLTYMALTARATDYAVRQLKALKL